MQQQGPESPAARRLARPRWLDGRLVLGVLLVLVSVVVGARVLSAADRSQTVWAVTHDLSPGTQLSEGDLKPTRVRLFGSGARYLATSARKPTGYVLRRAVGRDELLPGDALGRPQDDLAFRSVTVAVPRGHLPPGLVHGRMVDVYVTPNPQKGAVRSSPGPASAAPRLVLPGVVVLDVPRAAGIASRQDEAGVVLQVRPGQVALLLAAVAEGGIDLVQVPAAGELAQQPPPTGAG